MNLSFLDATRSLVRTLVQVAEERPDVRDALEKLREGLLELAAEIPTSASGSSSTASTSDQVRETGVLFDRDQSVQDRRLNDVARSTESGVVIPPGTGDRRTRERRPPDLRMVAKRANWKADAIRWAVERRRAEEVGGGNSNELHAREEELRARREELDECFAWMMDRYRKLPEDERMLFIAESYENVALAAESTMSLISAGILDPAPPAELLYALAETQSALLAALSATDLRTDSDQRDLFLWLKNQTLRHRIYVDRHMKLDDPADFTSGRARGERLRKLSETLIGRREAQRQQTHLLGKLKYHITKLGENSSPSGPDLDSICSAVAEWSEAGNPPQHPRLLEALRPLPKILGDVPPPPALGELCSCLSACRETTPMPSDTPSTSRRETAVPRAAELMKGLRALILGAVLDDSGRDQLTQDLALASVEVSPLGADASEDYVRNVVPTSGVDLVLIVTRLPEPTYEEFKRICRERQLPFVRLPGGVRTAEIAQQTMRQVGRMLQARSSMSAQ